MTEHHHICKQVIDLKNSKKKTSITCAYELNFNDVDINDSFDIVIILNQKSPHRSITLSMSDYHLIYSHLASHFNFNKQNFHETQNEACDENDENNKKNQKRKFKKIVTLLQATNQDNDEESRRKKKTSPIKQIILYSNRFTVTCEDGSKFTRIHFSPVETSEFIMLLTLVSYVLHKMILSKDMIAALFRKFASSSQQQQNENKIHDFLMCAKNETILKQFLCNNIDIYLLLLEFTLFLHYSTAHHHHQQETATKFYTPNHVEHNSDILAG